MFYNALCIISFGVTIIVNLSSMNEERLCEQLTYDLVYMDDMPRYLLNLQVL